MFSVAQLLLPVSAESACGEDISFSKEVDEIAKARMHDDPTLDQGEWVVALREADWNLVAARSARLIESRSKDLRLAAWLAEALAHTRGLRGLGDGYAVLTGLCEHYWDGLHPLPEEGDQEQRIGNLHWLLARTPVLVRAMPVAEDGSCSMLDIEAARQRVAAAADPGQQSGEPYGDPYGGHGEAAAALARMEAARRRNGAAYSAAQHADAEYCLAALEGLEQVLDRRLGADGPAFRAAREALQAALEFLTPAGVLAAAGVPDQLAPAARDAAGAPRARAQALVQLRQVADFFRRTEPHSPVAYMAEKAAAWGEMPLHVWLRAVVKDASTLGALEELLGADTTDS
ncbi:type VI secretion system protein TssA [Oxalobacteraceae bacterium A2-2]